jgi:hypothetical protein
MSTNPTLSRRAILRENSMRCAFVKFFRGVSILAISAIKSRIILPIILALTEESMQNGFDRFDMLPHFPPHKMQGRSKAPPPHSGQSSVHFP